MRVYIVAITSGTYMYSVHPKIYKNKKLAQKKCDELNLSEGSEKYAVLCADNWYKETRS